MRIAVMGAGGVGACLGARLIQVGADVTLVARGEHLKAMQRNGLRLIQADGYLKVPVKATDDPCEVGPVDLVLLAVKIYHIPEAAHSMDPMIGPKTHIVTLQNGVDSADGLAELFGPDRVLPGTSYTIASIASPGVIKQQSKTARIIFGRADGQITLEAEAVQDCLTPAIDAELTGDIASVLWSKFLLTAPGNAINATSRVPITRLIQTDEGRDLLVRAMKEVAEVGLANGVNIDPEAIPKGIKFMESLPQDQRMSMLDDIEAGRPLELNAQAGAVVRIGRRVGVPTPINDALYALLMPHKDGAPPQA
ncbi:MAG: 2-dehydropantoate 2-reductase [Chloroflexi bacterium]|nr:2-dehydropantoate 2-reductase [Chloroflexota bacterium]MDP6498670.1 2-dehydropantoate 2-reductase [Dehalococcoidia bacterium]MQG53924.1 2-dehydropantoate 2-reductase [SAR202 cluster bacterium]